MQHFVELPAKTSGEGSLKITPHSVISDEQSTSSTYTSVTMQQTDMPEHQYAALNSRKLL